MGAAESGAKAANAKANTTVDASVRIREIFTSPVRRLMSLFAVSISTLSP